MHSARQLRRQGVVVCGESGRDQAWFGVVLEAGQHGSGSSLDWKRSGGGSQLRHGRLDVFWCYSSALLVAGTGFGLGARAIFGVEEIAELLSHLFSGKSIVDADPAIVDKLDKAAFGAHLSDGFDDGGDDFALGNFAVGLRVLGKASLNQSFHAEVSFVLLCKLSSGANDIKGAKLVVGWQLAGGGLVVVSFSCHVDRLDLDSIDGTD